MEGPRSNFPQNSEANKSWLGIDSMSHRCCGNLQEKARAPPKSNYVAWNLQFRCCPCHLGIWPIWFGERWICQGISGAKENACVSDILDSSFSSLELLQKKFLALASKTELTSSILLPRLSHCSEAMIWYLIFSRCFLCWWYMIRRAISRSAFSLPMLKLLEDLDALIVLLLSGWWKSWLADETNRNASGVDHNQENVSAATNFVNRWLDIVLLIQPEH